MADVNRVIEIALNEVGYLEKSREAYRNNPQVLYSKTDGAGSDNYTKYGKEMHDLCPSTMDFPAYWCDAFVDWVFYRAYGQNSAMSLLGGKFDDYTVASAKLYQNKGALDTLPSIGAQVFFTKNGQVSGIHHTGIVYDVDAIYFYTVEGNTSGASGVVRNGGGVAKKKYSIEGYKGRVFFGHPGYDSNHKVFPYKRGEAYRVMSNMNIRQEPSLSGKIIGSIKAGSTVSCVKIVFNAPDSRTWMEIPGTSKTPAGFICADNGERAYVIK